MWENELTFSLLIVICVFLGGILLMLMINHRELMDVLRSLAARSQCGEKERTKKKNEDENV